MSDRARRKIRSARSRGSIFVVRLQARPGIDPIRALRGGLKALDRGLAAMKQATQTIPVVFVLVSDPVGSGLVANLARPGGNITGFQNFETDIGGKWLELLKEAAPAVRRVGVLYNQNIPANVEFLRTAQTQSSLVGVTVTPAELHDCRQH